jgi:hypothetical protein
MSVLPHSEHACPTFSQYMSVVAWPAVDGADDIREREAFQHSVRKLVEMSLKVVLFPDDSPLSSGDDVWVYKTRTPFAMGKIEQFNEQTKRYLVRYQDGSSYQVKRTRLIKVYPSGSIIVCADTDQYRRLGFSQIAGWAGGKVQSRGDSVLEIGCAEGDCTLALMNARPSCLVAVDKSDLCIEITTKKVADELARIGAAEEYQKMAVQVRSMDIFTANWKQELQFLEDSKRLVVFVDINGNRELPAVIRAIRKTEAELPECQMIIVKSSLLFSQLQKGVQLEELYKQHEDRIAR